MQDRRCRRFFIPGPGFPKQKRGRGRPPDKEGARLPRQTPAAMAAPLPRNNSADEEPEGFLFQASQLFLRLAQVVLMDGVPDLADDFV